MNENCVKIQNLFLELRFDEAEVLLNAEQSRDAENIAHAWLEESILFYKLFISEDKSLFESSNKTWKDLIQKTEKTKFNNAWYRYILSDMYLHRALIQFKFNQHLNAGGNIQNAHKLLKDNNKKFPYFLPDNINHGFLQCMFSSVPTKYQWLTKLIGFQGDLDEGLKEIEAYMNSDLSYGEHGFIQKEAAFVYALIQHHLNQNTEKAWSTIEKQTQAYKTHILENYMRASIASYNGMNDEVVEILKLKPKHNKAYPFLYMDYMLGVAKMRRLDSDADVYFKIFTVKYEGGNYLKAAYRNLAWMSIIKGNEIEAKVYYDLCLKSGIAEIEDDKQAFKEAQEKLIWPRDLLKARLLFDGEYYKKALQALNKVKYGDLNTMRYKLELNYRKARIYHESGEADKAIPFYMQTCENGKTQSYYYSAYSALQLGLIYENKKDYTNAAKYYKLAKSGYPNNTEYVSSIEQKAKAGLKRIKH
ncbi:MAG: hypothetical protein R2852_02875 [Bacteroidia bacterium]